MYKNNPNPSYLICSDDFFVWAADIELNRITDVYDWDGYSEYSYIEARNAVIRELKAKEVVI